MPGSLRPYDALYTEAVALLGRLRQLKPYSLSMPMVEAAMLSAGARSGIDALIRRSSIKLDAIVCAYIAWLRAGRGRIAPDDAQKKFALLKIKFNSMLSQIDLFADILNQRSEHDTGVWLGGLDNLASDAIGVPGLLGKDTPLACYLDRGHGAAIRRIKTKLPGGDFNPCAIIRVPRERMVGAGVAASLIHEVGHQGSELLGLTSSLRNALVAQAKAVGRQSHWAYMERWISEIVADFWALSRLGIGATMGLMGVMSLPRPFVFAISLDDPHPFPWMRVKLSCAFGRALYPHPQWAEAEKLWDSLYPKKGLPEGQGKVVEMLEAGIMEFVKFFLARRPAGLRGASMFEAFRFADRQPLLLQSRFASWQGNSSLIYKASPTMVFAVLGQARANGALDPAREGEMLSKLLAHWAQYGRSAVSTVRPAGAATASAPARAAINERRNSYARRQEVWNR